MKRIITVVVVILMLSGLSVSAFGAEKAKEGNWDFNLSPLYLWMVDMEGEIGIGPVDTGVKVDFGTIFDNLEKVFTVHFEATHRSN